MTGNPNQFKSFTSCQFLSLVTIVDGSVFRISGFGTINASSLVLDRVLHVSKLSFNLLSINQLVKSLNCSMTFFPTYCVLQDLQTNRMIRHGSNHGEFITLILLGVCHCHLGHPSLSNLRNGVSFSGSVCEINCDACQSGKHHKAYIPSRESQSLCPFNLIHSDVWGFCRYFTVKLSIFHYLCG